MIICILPSWYHDEQNINIILVHSVSQHFHLTLNGHIPILKYIWQFYMLKTKNKPRGDADNLTMTLLSLWDILKSYAIINLENEKVMFHYNILFSYWIIQTSQLGSHWKWNGISVSRHNEGACNLVLIQFGIVGVTIPRDRDSHVTRRRHC